MASPAVEMVYPDPVRRRRYLLGMVLLFVLVAPLGVWGAHGLSGYIQSLAESDDSQDLGQFMTIARWILIGGPLSLLIFASWLFWLARRIFQVGRFPLPGQLVLRPTPLRTGTQAHRFAWGAISMGFVVTLLALTGSYLGWQVMQSLSSNL